MTDLVETLWQRAQEKLYITREQFVASLEGWTIEPIEVAGETAFVTLRRGPEFHFSSLETGHRIPLGVIRARLAGIIAEHGYALARTPKDDRKQRRVNEFFGARIVGEDTFDVHYRLDSLKGEAPCPSSP